MKITSPYHKINSTDKNLRLSFSFSDFMMIGRLGGVWIMS